MSNKQDSKKVTEQPKKLTKTKPKSNPKDDKYSIGNVDIFRSPEQKQEQREMTTEDIKYKMASEAFSLDALFMRTDLNQKQIIMVTRLQLFADVFDIPELHTVINNFLQLQVSKGRQGRKEFTSMVQNAMSTAEQETGKSALASFFGKE